MNKIFVCSPYRPLGGNTIEENFDLVKRLCRGVALAGHMPFAPHLYCPLFLNDALESERNLGIEIGRTMLRFCEGLWVYDTLGISKGMEGDIARAIVVGVPVTYMPDGFHILPKREEIPA